VIGQKVSNQGAPDLWSSAVKCYIHSKSNLKALRRQVETLVQTRMVGEFLIGLSILQSIAAYNCPTTAKPVIYQFFENVRSVSTVLSVLYKKVKI